MFNILPQPVYDGEDETGSAVAPATTPSEGPEATPSSEETDVAESSNDFSGLSEDYEPDEASVDAAGEDQPPPVIPPAPAAPTPEAPGTQPPAPAETAPAQPVQPATPQSSQEPPAQVAEQQAPVSTGTQPQSLDDLAQLLAENESTLVDAVASSEFVLSPEELQELETDAVSAVPKLLGRAYVKTLKGAVNMMRQQLPQLIQQQVSVYNRQMEVERNFFQQFPALDRGKHGQQITTLANALRAQNRQMPVAELLTRVGRTVMALNDIAPPAVPAAAASPSQPRTTQITPFAPANSAPRVVTQQQVLDSNDFFAGLSQDYEDG